jgi:S1-C subfamily serine protease
MRLSFRKEQNLGIHFDVTDQGIQVTEVLPHSPAKKFGLEPGDVILAVYGHPVTSADTWNWLMAGKSGYVQLRIQDFQTGSVVTRYVNLG